MKEYNFFKKDGRSPSQEHLLNTKLFYQNAPEIYARFDEWKDIDKFYFTPLYMEMTYSCGWVAEIAPDPVWLGSFVRCSLEHPDLFQFKCPKCGQPVYPYRYVGSPLSGRVDLEARCICGWNGFEMFSGWRLRAIALRDQLSNDKQRFLRFKLWHPIVQETAVNMLLDWLGL